MSKPGRKRIAFVAPVVPFRGGIAQHSSMLLNAMSTDVELKVFSYKRLYPSFLYPGKSQVDADSVIGLDVKVDYAVDSLNPISWKRVATRIMDWKPDAVLLPWWTFFLTPFYLYLSLRAYRSSVPLIYICHNVVDHEGSLWKRFLSKSVLRFGSGFVVQTKGEEQKLLKLIEASESRAVVRHSHPVYSQFPEPEGRLPRRAPLELLFYGFIRPYKGLDVLLNAVSKLPDVPLYLSIVGEPWGSSEWIRDAVRDLGLDGKVELVLSYVGDDATAEYFSRADAVVLPYRTATGTGVIATAYHYRKPVIASRVDGIVDVVIDGSTGLLTEAGNSEMLADAIRRFSITGIPYAEKAINKVLDSLTWSSLADAVVGLVDGNR